MKASAYYWLTNVEIKLVARWQLVASWWA